MRFRTAAILSIIVVSVLLAVPYALQAVVAPYIGSGIEIPLHKKLFLNIGLWLWSYRWMLMPVTVVVLFLLAAFTESRYAGERKGLR